MLTVGAVVAFLNLGAYRVHVEVPILGVVVAIFFLPGTVIAAVAAIGNVHLVDYRVIALCNGLFYAVTYRYLVLFRRSRRNRSLT